MSDDLTRALVRELARELPEALDDSSLGLLAAKLRPYFAPSRPTSADVPLMTAAEAASQARVDVETIRRAIRAGELPVAGRVGRSPRIQAVELERWLADTSGPGGTIPQSAGRRSRRPRQDNEYSLKAAFRAATSDRS
jgi:excisionase family DNA binding protein